MTLGHGMYHLGCRTYHFCSNGDPRLTLTYLTPSSNLLPNAFNLDFFGKIDFLNILKPKSLFSLNMLRGNVYY